MWLHVPSASLASAPVVADSTLGCDSLYQALARSATWREKSLPPASWRRALKRASWTTRLSGLTCSPSTLGHGAAAWIASLEVSPVSPSPTPASERERLTSATSGLPWPALYMRLRHPSPSLRMFPEYSATTTTKSDPSFKQWATTLRR